MKTVILTGGTGFLGFWLLKELVKNNIFVYVVVRKNSKRINRLNKIKAIQIIELDMQDIDDLPQYIKTADTFYHLAWEGQRNDFSMQMKNVIWSVNAMQVAEQIGVKQFIVTGSQAEYGLCYRQVNEDSPTNPNTAYGACKLACYDLLKTLSEQTKISLSWIRVFSVYGEGDNSNTLISYLLNCFKENKIPQLTTGDQAWDYLYAEDAANALYLLGEQRSCGLYNLASGESRPLKEFVKEVRDVINPNIKIDFGNKKQESFVELRADVNKIKNELGWQPKVNFRNGIEKMINN